MVLFKRIPDHLNDGYTTLIDGCLVRSMPASVSSQVFDEIRYGEVFSAVESVFAAPWFHGERADMKPVTEQAIFKAVVENPTEAADKRNLISGSKLRIKEPRAADFSCHTCREWISDLEKWEVYIGAGGVRNRRRPTDSLACETPGGCKRGHWKSPVAFNSKNTQAWNHYWQFRSSGLPLADCPTMRWNWMILEWIAIHGSTRKLRPAIRETA